MFYVEQFLLSHTIAQNTVNTDHHIDLPNQYCIACSWYLQYSIKEGTVAWK